MRVAKLMAAFPGLHPWLFSCRPSGASWGAEMLSHTLCVNDGLTPFEQTTREGLGARKSFAVPFLSDLRSILHPRSKKRDLGTPSSGESEAWGTCSLLAG